MFAFAFLGLAQAVPTLGDKEFDLNWMARDEMIQRHNAADHSWKMRHNEKFVGQPLGAAKSLCGAVLRDNTAIVQDPTFPKNLTIPDRFEAAERWPKCARTIGDIRDQSNCGCCWAFAATESATDRLCVGTGGAIDVPLSAENLCFCAEAKGCQGGMLNTAWEYVRGNGLVTGGQYNGTGPFGKGLCVDFSLAPMTSPSEPMAKSPQCPTKCDKGAKAQYANFETDRYGFKGEIDLLSNEDMIQKSMLLGGPVETAFTVYGDFPNYDSGVYHQTNSTVLGGHAVKIVGWGELEGTKYWRIANSWTSNWGEKGYFLMLRGVDECGIESQAMASSHTAKWGKMNEL